MKNIRAHLFPFSIGNELNPLLAHHKYDEFTTEKKNNLPSDDLSSVCIYGIPKLSCSSDDEKKSNRTLLGIQREFVI